MGVVYEAFDEDRGIPVALKTLRRVSPTALYLFKQEFRSIAGISHPNLVAIYELFAGSPENWFFTMQLLRGQGLVDFLRRGCPPPAFENRPGSMGDFPTSEITSSLEPPTSGHDALNHNALLSGPFITADARKLLQKGFAPPPALVRNTFRQVVEGIAALHAAGKLHRDIKPTNVMVTISGEAKVLDFGLAVDEFTLQQPGSHPVVGTSTYMAPEQALGRPISPASDWYSVGVMLYQVLCGESPFQGSLRHATDAKLNRNYPKPGEIANRVDPDLEELVLSLLEVDPSSRPTSAEILARLSDGSPRAAPIPGSRVAVPFYGRHQEQVQLQQAMAVSLSGSVAFALVHGDSGVGKSTLMQHYVHQEAGAGLVLRGRCYEQESVPYKAIDSAVDALCQHLLTLPRKELAAMLPADISLLAQLFPVVNRLNERVLFPAPGTGANDARRIRRRSVRALRELLSQLRRDRPVVLTIDDLQWGDVDSILLLGEIFAPPDPPPLLVLCTYRREYIDRSPCLTALFEMQKAGSAIQWFDVAVEPFSTDDTQHFAQSLLDQSLLEQSSTSAEIASRIARESGGNPYFAVELARYASRVHGPDDQAPASESVGIGHLLRHRIAALPADSRSLLQVVALHSKPLAQIDAYRAAGLGVRDPAPLNALRLENLVRSAGFNQEDQIESFHDRVRDAALQGLAIDRLRSLHSSLAATLETSERGDAESLALHNERAGKLTRARHYHELAGDRAAAAAAFDRAAGNYRSCLAMLEPDSPKEAALRAKLGEALVNSGRSVEAARELEAAALQTAGKAKIELERQAAFHYAASGYIEEGNVIFKRVLARVGLKFPRTKRAILFSLLLTSVRLRLRGSRFCQRDPAQVPSITFDRFDAAWSVALPLSLTNTAQAMNFGLQALLLAMEAGDPVRFVYGLEYAYVLALQGGEARRRADALIETARGIVARQQDPNLEGVLHLVQGSIAYTQAGWQECIRFLEKAEDIFANRVRGAYSHLAQVRSLHLYALWSAGDFDEIARRSGQFLQEAEQLGDLFSSVNFRSFGQPLAHLVAGRPDLARQCVTAGLSQWAATGYQLIHGMAAIVLSWIAFYERRAPGNLGFVEEQWQLIRANDMDRFENMRATCLDFRCRTALAAANWEGSSPQLRKQAWKIARESHRILAGETNAWGRASAAVAKAAFEEIEGKSDVAARTLLAAAEQFEAVSMMGYAWSARRRAGETIAGREGQDLVTAADRWFHSQSIVQPEYFAAMHVGGFATRELPIKEPADAPGTGQTIPEQQPVH